jgi:hypothetical protein
MSLASGNRVAMPTTGAPTINSPSPDGDVGAIAVIGADTTECADGTTEGDERSGAGVAVSIDDEAAGATADGGSGVGIEISTGGGVGVPAQSSRARGAVDSRPMDEPHATQKRCPGGFVALHAGQIAGPSALNDFENLNDGASGR